VVVRPPSRHRLHRGSGAGAAIAKTPPQRLHYLHVPFVQRAGQRTLSNLKNLKHIALLMMMHDDD
jgi:hypothetical protein